MANWNNNSCPKCGGNLFIDVDETGFFDHCLQCGYVHCRTLPTCPTCGAVLENINGGYHCLNCDPVEVA